jgi:hypothetical protein
MAIAETSRCRCLFSSSNTTSRWSSADAVGNQGLTSAMKTPMSNIVFGMAAATLSNGIIRDVISNAPVPRCFPQTKQATAVDSLDIDLAQTAIGIRPDLFCYLLRVIARPSCASRQSPVVPVLGSPGIAKGPRAGGQPATGGAGRRGPGFGFGFCFFA